MKYLLAFLFLSSVLACKNSSEKSETEIASVNQEVKYENFGDEIQAANALSVEALNEKYENLQPGDTLQLKFAGKVNSVCKMKGCWMKLDLPGDEEVRVTFKDYGFFVPKDIEDREVIVEGKAFLKEISVEDQKHFAEDEGKSEEEIAAITQAQLIKSFEAHGVLLKD